MSLNSNSSSPSRGRHTLRPLRRPPVRPDSHPCVEPRTAPSASVPLHRSGDGNLVDPAGMSDTPSNSRGRLLDIPIHKDGLPIEHPPATEILDHFNSSKKEENRRNNHVSVKHVGSSNPPSFLLLPWLKTRPLRRILVSRPRRLRQQLPLVLGR
jgi:hypothetical protein